MRKYFRIAGLVGIALSGMSACATAPANVPGPTPEPGNLPVVRKPTPVPNIPTPPVGSVPSAVASHETKSWNFAYVPGAVRYSISLRGTIADLPDSANTKSPISYDQQFLVQLADSGPTQILEPATLSSALCTPENALAVRAIQLIPKLPSQFETGVSWTDSTSTAGCQLNIPTSVYTKARYTVLGDTSVNGVSALQIRKVSAISESGEGASGQHRVLFNASGTIDAILLFNPALGQFIGSTAKQFINITLSTSGKTAKMVQTTTQVLTRL